MTCTPHPSSTLAATALLGAHTAHAQTPSAPLRVILPLGAMFFTALNSRNTTLSPVKSYQCVTL